MGDSMDWTSDTLRTYLEYLRSTKILQDIIRGNTPSGSQVRRSNSCCGGDSCGKLIIVLSLVAIANIHGRDVIKLYEAPNNVFYTDYFIQSLS